ncbi:DUF1345 domain-containing protein [Jiangella aurantiaca]|uniref:DUF1345 domain-containing protein n=1 Tax=Jiangella aurantiaca TaxID=2530373 RepID=A0A4R5ADK9_9ACTN|nr:DUF1345 domain-containing protein [Jiangella aurantiaca]TDD68924.1 DUF1345 domain-containing protein [Jiangella aurantiaca]
MSGQPPNDPGNAPGAASAAAAIGESRWGAGAAVLVAALVTSVLPERLTTGPRWALPALELALLAALLAANPRRLTRKSRDARALSLVLIAVIGATNALSLVSVVHQLLVGDVSTGRELVYAAAGVWLTNVVLFGLVFWELDRGGPHARSTLTSGRADLLFPQMTMDRPDDPAWSPSFMDYLYVSFTNSTAFSPTDTMPLTPRVKLAMTVQALLSLVTLGLVIARAVNVLG